MKILCLALTLCFTCFLQANALTQGMSIRAVENELGQPESRLNLGTRDILNYANEGALVFVEGALVSANNLPLPSASTAPSRINDPATIQNEAPLLETELPIMLVSNDHQSITQSYQEENLELEQIANGFDYKKISQELEGSIHAKHQQSAKKQPPSEQERLATILIGFILEVVITLIVLKVAFSVCGFPSLWRQLILLSIAVALVGAALSFILNIGPLNPTRIGFSSIVLLLLIRKLTDVREWATAIKIAITARIVSIIVMWLAFAGSMALFGI